MRSSLCSLRFVLLVALAPLVATGARAQAPAPGSRPAPVVSPEIAADNRVTFRLRAPDARSVSVSGQFQRGPAPMAKGESGVWSVTVGPVAPDLYEYSFTVDGVQMIDPGNRAIKPMRNPRTSVLEIPGRPPGPHDFQDVPHGRVTLHWYQSKALGVRRALQVYTPPNYEADPAARFPTLYLFHGSGDNEATWVANGHAHWILDNLIAQRRARPMIIVMTDGHAADPSGDRRGNLDAFERDLLQDVMPLVAKQYRTHEEPAQRGIIGLSMGGNQSLIIGLRHADRFAWVGGMSSAVMMNAESEADTTKLIGDGSVLTRRLKLLWIACGREDRLLGGNQKFADALAAKKVPHQWVITDGGHSWPVWRKYLTEFLPLVFVDGRK